MSKHYPVYDRPHHRLLEVLSGGRLRYGREFAALEGVSFSVAAGETVGIIGRNGSGKSTLLQMVCGTLSPTSGSIRIKGSVAALLELGAGFNPEFSGMENIRLNAAILGLSQAQVNERLDRILAFADIGDFVHQPVKTYSSGMFVRLAFAVVAHVDADVLVIDEALSVGDAFFTQKCMRFLRGFRDQGGTLLFVSHDSGAVVGLCDRAIWLDKGRLRAEGSAKAVTEQYLHSKYAGEDDAVGAMPAAVSADEPVAAEEAALVVGGGALAIPDEGAGQAFGAGGATLTRVTLQDEGGRPILVTEGGERAVLRIEARLGEALEQPIFGFYVKDRLGQVVFGENTAGHPDQIVRTGMPGETLATEFRFRMPHLQAGDYVITAAVGEGDQDAHRIHHWIHDALAFRSQSVVLHGLLALPTAVRMCRVEPVDA
ncbi:ABC transporter ATP-binding protein [Chitinimonas arctica]|uniref:ABC transporter ATP-binding protein n=1 Tax=Chitinimonas arctica TaxID=2594795 RepID=UPI0027E51B03|nr:ABC transporter ATP-binding protein [Chitinimonas arctica]